MQIMKAGQNQPADYTGNRERTSMVEVDNREERMTIS